MTNEDGNAMIINQLKNFHKELRSYERLLDKETQLSEAQRRYKESLRERLIRRSGALKELLIDLTGKQYYVSALKGRIDIWDEAFYTVAFSRASDALKFCINAVNQAIGKLELYIQMGIRDEQGNLIHESQIVSKEPLRAFISHGKESVALRKLKEFIETLGIEPLIVKKQASLDKDLPDKVNLYLNQADFVIILATRDDKVTDDKTEKETIQPRQNVIHEIGLAQKVHPGRIIYLLEEGAEFPSNIRPRVWESFKQRNMMGAFLGIVRELRAYGMLKIIKTPPEEQRT